MEKLINIASPANVMDGLRQIGQMDDNSINMTEAALLMGARYHPDLSLDRYRNHIKSMVKDTASRHAELLDNGVEDDLPSRLSALKYALFEANGYKVVDTIDDIQDSDLTRVIDRRRGITTVLVILSVHMGRGQNWSVDGLNMPGRFLLRLEKGSERLISDLMREMAIVQAHDLRHIVKNALGEQAELSAEYYEPVSNRFFLLCLQNNIKTRQISVEDYEGALDSVRMMQAIAPDEYRLLLDAGVLCARTGRKEAAIEALEGYIERAPDGVDRYDAIMFLQEIRQNMS